MKKIKTLRFGEIEAEPGKIIHFDQGMPAFEGEHEFMLILQEMDSWKSSSRKTLMSIRSSRYRMAVSRI